jgi:hypothetical protein
VLVNGIPQLTGLGDFSQGVEYLAGLSLQVWV